MKAGGGAETAGIARIGFVWDLGFPEPTKGPVWSLQRGGSAEEDLRAEGVELNCAEFECPGVQSGSAATRLNGQSSLHFKFYLEIGEGDGQLSGGNSFVRYIYIAVSRAPWGPGARSQLCHVAEPPCLSFPTCVMRGLLRPTSQACYSK